MVGSDAGRENRKKKGNRWTMFFPSRGPSQIRAWIQAVRHVLNAGRVDVKVEEGSGSVVLVWPKAVTFYSAYRVHKMARDENPSFETGDAQMRGRGRDGLASGRAPGGRAGARFDEKEASGGGRAGARCEEKEASLSGSLPGRTI